jgi:hypothetical protein
VIANARSAAGGLPLRARAAPLRHLQARGVLQARAAGISSADAFQIFVVFPRCGSNIMTGLIFQREPSCPLDRLKTPLH